MSLQDSAQPHHIGPYTLETLLGEGGAGQVYSARRGDAPAVAVKVLRSAEVASLKSLMVEIEAMTRLNHPGVVSIIEQGEDGGVPWYAMELVEGQTVRQWLKGEPGLGVVLLLFARLARTWAWIHGAGCVHRDLKPENVMVRSGHEPVLLDLGLATWVHGAEGRSVLNVPIEVAGTLAYMTPGQIGGEPCDARADLYAFGCMLFETLAKEHPFTGLEAVDAHLNAPIPDLGEARPELPQALRTLVSRLMAKSPHERPAYAIDVARELASVMEAQQRAAFENESARLQTPRPYLVRPRFVGRGPLCDAMHGYLKSCFAKSRGAAVWLGGERGVGKTRFALELGRRLSRQGAGAVVVGRCGDAVLQRDMAPWEGVLTLAAQRLDPAQDVAIEHHMAVLAPYSQALRMLDGLPTLEGPRSGMAVAQSMAGILGALSKNGPLVVLLDDVQWADARTLRVLKYLLKTRALEHMPVAILSTFRHEESDEALLEMTQHEGGRCMTLGRLEAAAIKGMIGDMLASDAPRGFVSHITEQSEGNPFYVSAMLHAAIDAGVLGRDEAGVWQLQETSAALPWEALGVPASLRDSLSQRLENLGDDALTLVQRLALLGRDGALTLVERVMTPALLATFGQLIHRHMISLEGTQRWTFEHGLLREVVLDAMDDTTKTQHHQAIAQALEVDHLPTALVATRAFHWEAAGNHLFAARDHHTAMLHASETFQLDGVLTHSKAFLTLSPEPSLKRVNALMCRSSMLNTIDGKERLEVLQEAEADLNGLDPEHKEAHIRLELNSRLEIARTALGAPIVPEIWEALLNGYQAQKRFKNLSDLIVILADGLIRASKSQQAMAYLQRARAICQEHALVRTEAKVLERISFLLSYKGQHAEALGHIKLAVEGFQRSRSPASEVNAQITLGVIQRNQGHLEDAMHTGRAALLGSHKMGMLVSEGIASGNLGTVLLELGQLERAMEMCQRANRLNERANYPGLHPYTLHTMAQILALQGHHSAARDSLQDATSRAKTQNNNHALARCLVTTARFACDDGNLERAAQALGEAAEICRKGQFQSIQIRLHSIHARLARLLKDTPLALEHQNALRDMLQDSTNTLEHILLPIEEGHAALAASPPNLQNAQRALAQVQHQLTTHNIPPQSPSGQRATRLAEAIEAHRQGTTLQHDKAPQN